MILHTVDQRSWGQPIDVGGKLYSVDDDGYVVVDNTDHAIVLLCCGAAWSRVASDKITEAAPMPVVLPLSSEADEIDDIDEIVEELDELSDEPAEEEA